MAKLKIPLLSFSARGTLAKVLTYKRKGHTNIAEVTPDPPDARSLAQLSWRHMYQKAVALWHALSPAEQLAWQSAANSRHMTGYAWFMSQCLRPNPGIYLPLQGGTMSGEIDMDDNAICGLVDPTTDDKAARKAYVDAEIEAAKQKQGCRVTNSIALDIANTTWTAITFDQEHWDTDDIHDPGANPERLTCKTAGIYLLHGQVTWEAAGLGVRTLAITKNGHWWASCNTNHRGAAISCQCECSTFMDMSVGDYARLLVYQDRGGNLDVLKSADISPEFMMQRIG